MIPHNFSQEWIEGQPPKPTSEYLQWTGADGKIISAKNPVANLKEGDKVWVGCIGRLTTATFTRSGIESRGHLAESRILIDFKSVEKIRGVYVVSLKELPLQAWEATLPETWYQSKEDQAFTQTHLKAGEGYVSFVSSWIKSKKQGDFVMACLAKIAGPDGLGDFDSGECTLFKKKGSSWQKVSEKNPLYEHPVIDVDGDGFPEFASVNLEGEESIYMARVLPKRETLEYNGCE